MSAEPVDPRASWETRNLLRNLHGLAGRGLLFGMQDATGYGVGWSGDDDRSDVRDVCGDYPAVIGEDLRRVELGDQAERVRYRIESAYRRGAVITLSWHQHDPAGRGYEAKAVGGERVVASILPGGPRHDAYRAKLSRIAAFLTSLRGVWGEPVPVIFRPYHEHTGDWFWWGSALCTPEEFRDLWISTFHILHDELGVHNLIWAISPGISHIGTSGGMCAGYPGDAYVDLVGADAYFEPELSAERLEGFRLRVRTLVTFGAERGKLAALTEVGQEGIPCAEWFTKALLGPIVVDEVNRGLSYALVWRNADGRHHFAPYPGHPSVPDFLRFFADPRTVFLADLPRLYRPPLDSSKELPIL